MDKGKKQLDSSAGMIKLNAGGIIDMIVERHLAQLGWNPATKKCDRQPVICRPIVMVGPAGIGKSELPAQAAKQVAAIIDEPVTTRDCNLQYLEAPDLAGLAENVLLERERVTVHGRPGLLPSTGKGIWFLDEPNRVNRDIRSAMLTLIQARRVNDYKLGAGWMIVMAMNPSEYNGVTYEVGEWDRALRDRVTFVWFQPEMEELLNYLQALYGNHMVLKWVRSQGVHAETNYIITFKGEEKRITPRALEFLIRAIEASGGIRSKTWFRAAKAEVGEELAVQLSQFAQQMDVITAEEVIDSFGDEVREKMQRFEAEGHHDVLSNLSAGVAALTFKRFGVPDSMVKSNGGTDDNTVNFTEAGTKLIANVRSYLECTPADMKASFFMAVGEKMQTLPNKFVYPNFVREMMKSKVLEEHFSRVKASVRQADERLKKVTA